MERAKVREVDNVRYLFLVRFFLEYFIALREYEVAQSIDPASEDGHDFDLIAEISEASTIGYVALRMKLCLEEEVGDRYHNLNSLCSQSLYPSLSLYGRSCTLRLTASFRS